MSNKINVLDPHFKKIGELENIKSAEIYEVINNQYVADVEIAENTFPSFLNYPNMLEIDGDYFIIADIDKQRSNSKSISLSLEHVSYLLNDPSGAITIEDEQEEFYEGTIKEIIHKLWGGIEKFTITTDITGEFLYIPKATGGRSRIQEFARQNGFEVEYSKFNIIIHQRRGSDKGLEFRVGNNVKSVTQKITLNDEFNLEYAHEVDIIDFSQLPSKQQEDIASAEIGDTVSIIDTDLAIDANERIVAKRYNPLFKEVPKISVGQVIRDIVDFINKEEAGNEEDPTVNFLLSTFRVGKIDCLQLNNIEFEYDSVLPDDISASVDYFITGQHQGVTIALKPQYSKYHVVITKYYSDDTFQEFDLNTYSKSWSFPEPGLEGLNITVSEVPLSEIDLDKHIVKNYGIKFSKNLIDPLREFKIGNVNVLGMGAEIDNDSAIESVEDISTVLEHTAVQKYEGVRLSLKREFKDYHITILTFNKNGTPSIHSYESYKDILPTLQLPSDDIQYFLVTVSEVPINKINPYLHKVVHFGVKFEKQIFEPLSDFVIGDEDVLRMTNVLFEKPPRTYQIQEKIYFDEYEELRGIVARLKKEYNKFFVRVLLYENDGNVVEIESNDHYTVLLPTLNASHIVVEVLEQPPDLFDSEKHLQAYYAVSFVRNPKEDEEDEEDPNDPTSMYWLETFSIDGVDMLIENGVDDNIGALLEVDTIPKNIVVTIKEKYREYFIGVFTEQNGKGERTFSNSDFTNGSLTINNGFTEAFKNGFVRVILSDKPLNTPRADVQTFLVELKLTTNTDVEDFLLESLNVDNTEYVNSYGIDEPGGAEETIYDRVKRLRVKIKDDPAITDINVTVNYGEISFNYSKTQFVNGLLSVTPTMPEKVEKAVIQVVIKKDAETFTYTLNLELFKDDDENATGPSYYIESETVTATSAGAQFDFTVPYDAVISVVPGVGKVDQEEPVTAHCSLIQDETGMYTGVSVEVKGLKNGSVDVSIQAVVQEGVEIEVESSK